MLNAANPRGIPALSVLLGRRQPPFSFAACARLGDVADMSVGPTRSKLIRKGMISSPSMAERRSRFLFSILPAASSCRTYLRQVMPELE